MPVTTSEPTPPPPDNPTTAMATAQQSLSTNRFAALAEEDDEDDEEAKHATACPDTAATGHFIPPGCKGKQLPHQPIEAMCANKTSMKSIATMELEMPHLAPAMKSATAFEETMKPLFSVPVMADEGCEITFREKDMDAKKDNQTTLSGTRDPVSRLWLAPMHCKKESRPCGTINGTT